MKKAASILCLVGLFGLTAGPPAFADTITGFGTASTTWKETKASASLTTEHAAGPDTVVSAAETSLTGAPVDADVAADGAGGGGANAAPYLLSVSGGSIDPDTTLRASAYFRDEIYFSTTDISGTGGLEFDFDVSYALINFFKDQDGALLEDGDSYAEFGMDLWYGDPAESTSRRLDAFSAVLEGDGTLGKLYVDQLVVTLSTFGNDNSTLLESGNYFPFQFNMWIRMIKGGGGAEASEQLSTFKRISPAFRGVRVFAGTPSSPLGGGFRQLTNPDDYELWSANGYDLKPIPEPASLFLLGTGLLGLGAWRKRH